MVKIVITGRPGSGKTTVFMKVIEELRRKNISIAGFFCPEVRERGVRIGFKIIDIASGEEDWLALEISRAMKLGYELGPRIGKYSVIPSSALRIGLKALDKARVADVVAIDELGPMELKIPKLRKAIIETIRVARNALLVVHWRLSDLEIMSVLKEAKRYIVTPYNRNQIPKEILNEFLKSKR
ncbi:MAG: nucleoside triphosphatase [Thermoprotei archaeon]|nr:MAG: nucleoside triphosphatase [Thermoprotei archaeon]